MTHPTKQSAATPTLFDQPRPTEPSAEAPARSNLQEWSVSDLSKRLKQTVEDNFSHVRIRGEIGECKLHASGHLYLSLKDDQAVIAAVCWRGTVSKLGLKPAVGMEVVCTGRLTTYMGQSKYQLVVENMALAGLGALLKMLEERKAKLAAEGLFDPARKRPLPKLPHVIGVITSPTGAVIRDILHRLADRFPRHVLLWPVAVQGDGAATQVARAVAGFNALPRSGGSIPRPDLLIIARGGGSVEDLMPFNEESVVRAVAASTIPVISAVGHETDTTLIDYAADKRAPTPTAAAEMAVPVRHELLAIVHDYERRLSSTINRSVTDKNRTLHLLDRALGDPLRVFEPLSQRLDEWAERLDRAWRTLLTQRFTAVAERGGRLRHPRDSLRLASEKLSTLSHKQESAWHTFFLRREGRLATLTASLSPLSPRAVLERGYVLIQDTVGHIITSATQSSPDAPITLHFHDGTRNAVFKE